jgi:hypothetical protein
MYIFNLVSGILPRNTNLLSQIVDSSFRLGDQLRGSSGSLDGVGTRMMSELPLCFDRRTWCKSTKVTVPGIAAGSMVGAIPMVADAISMVAEAILVVAEAI